MQVSSDTIDCSIEFLTAVRDVFVSNCLLSTKHIIKANGKCVEMMFSDCVLFSSSENKAIEIQSDLGGANYNEGWTFVNCTIDVGGSDSFEGITVSDIYVFQVTNCFIGCSIAFIGPTETTHTRDILLSNNYISGKVILQCLNGTPYRTAVISNNKIAGNIITQSVDYVTISDNIFMDASGIAIFLDSYSTNISICNNQVANTYTRAVSINQNVTNCIIDGLTFKNNSEEAIFAENLANVTLKNIIAAKNEYGREEKNIPEGGSFTDGSEIFSMPFKAGIGQHGFIILAVNITNSSSGRLTLRMPDNMEIPQGSGWGAQYVRFTDRVLRCVIPYHCSGNVDGNIKISNNDAGTITIDYHSWISVTRE
jgi:hypothetical protein